MSYLKVCIYVPETHADEVRKAIGDAGAGKIGNYSHWSFSSTGEGRFLPLEGANPYIGAIGELEIVKEVKIETICTKDLLDKILDAMKHVHPYEEPAYEVSELLTV